MRRRFHIVAVTRDLQQAFVVQTAAGWLLPCLDDDPRAALPVQVEALLTQIVGAAEMIHEAALACDDEAAQIAHGCVVAVIENNPRLLRIDDLLAQRALLPLQRRALVASLARLRNPTAPFDSRDQVAQALAWVDAHITRSTGARSLAMTKHRCARHEYVIVCETTAGTMCFKGGRERTHDEATLTEMLWRLDAQRFPETVAIDAANDRWLYRALPGELLFGTRLTMRTAIEAVHALAGVQRLAMTSSAVRAHFANRSPNRCLDAAGLFDRAERIVEHDAALHERWRAASDRFSSICRAVDALCLPQTLVLSDFWGRNIVQTPAGLGFIDLEQSYWSYPFLSLWKFIIEVERCLPAHRHARATLQDAFIDAWRGVTPVGTLARALDHLPLLGRLFGILVASRELDLEERGFGDALPAGYRAGRLAKYVDRCLELAASVPH